MDLNDLAQKKARLEEKAHNQIQEALKSIRHDIQAANENVDKELNELKNKNIETEIESEVEQPNIIEENKDVIKKSLVYFSYPIEFCTEEVLWVSTLRQILVSNGYLVYDPLLKVEEQFGQQDLAFLNSLSLRTVKSLCSVLCIPEEVLLPFDVVWTIMQKASEGDNISKVFQSLWFLTRSNLVICDFAMKNMGYQMPQELLYAKQLNIPVVGLFPSSCGKIYPFAQGSTTCLFTGNDLLSLLPIIKGYAP